jgi:hypothetical protein
MYRVGFGDFFLVTVPSSQGPLHVLVDCGALHGKGDIGTLEAAVDDMATETGKKLALIVVTHRHADHLSGFTRCGEVFETFQVGGVWMPIWETEYDDDVARAQAELTALALDLQVGLAARDDIAGRAMRDMLYNATGVEPFGIAGARGSNADALRRLKHGLGVTPRYYAAGDAPELPASLAVAGLEAQILGPPPVDQMAFLRLMDLRKGVGEYLGAGGARTGDGARLAPFGPDFQADVSAYPAAAFSEFAPPGAEESSAYFNAPMEALLHGVQPEVALDAVKQLDSHLNNQSLVVLFTFKGRRLLFVGDAQAGNWEYWLYQGAGPSPAPSGEIAPGSLDILSSIDLYKVGHHGSTNATPIQALSAMREGTTALCSTEAHVYGTDEKNTEVPRRPLLEAIEEKGALVRSDQIDVEVDGVSVPRAEETPPELPAPAEGRFRLGTCYVDYFL